MSGHAPRRRPCASTSTAGRRSRRSPAGSLDHGPAGPDRPRTATGSWRSVPGRPSRAAPAIVILPDVRGLHPYYEELALRFAEAGIDALAIDYFGRTAGIDTPRDDTFEYRAARRPDDLGRHRGRHPGGRGRGRDRTTTARVAVAVHDRLLLRRPAGVREPRRWGSGWPARSASTGRPPASRGNGTPVPVDVAGAMQGAVLGLFGGADAGIPPRRSPRSTRR